jgi:hypothetical protein
MLYARDSSSVEIAQQVSRTLIPFEKYISGVHGSAIPVIKFPGTPCDRAFKR